MGIERIVSAEACGLILTFRWWIVEGVFLFWGVLFFGGPVGFVFFLLDSLALLFLVDLACSSGLTLLRFLLLDALT